MSEIREETSIFDKKWHEIPLIDRAIIVVSCMVVIGSALMAILLITGIIRA